MIVYIVIEEERGMDPNVVGVYRSREDAQREAARSEAQDHVWIDHVWIVEEVLQ